MRIAVAGDLFRTRPRRALPRKVVPVHDETFASFLHRLALRNHVPGDVLHAYLGMGRPRRLPELTDLATVTGASQTVLSHALPELRDSASRHCGTTAGWPNQVRPACRHCVASRGIVAPVMCWMRPEQSVCPRHQLWIGAGVTTAAEQLDLSRLPEISRAQRRHRRIIRRHGHQVTAEAFTEATDIVAAWTQNETYDAARRRRHEIFYGPRRATHLHSSGHYAAGYPETVALSSLIASAYWRSLAVGNGAAAARFYAEVQRRVLSDYTMDSLQHDPVSRWVARKAPRWI
ncbi:TniQ family protein [Nonomuraea basaltis]|uniref:TniQ family protein n=1 Tax=Nonomuraea basaltis TaxID=2495887 RepID=UPI00110C3FF5|nr:TniQ family protein [Nonomuraea basaltis]TMR88810.1 hypothetical protein EJK15_64180 [Nonomuraea basaltis]